MLVIGAGWGRTGTDSTRVALNELGLGPCHHMIEVFKDGNPEVWMAAAQAASKQERQTILRKLLDSYKSCIDFPSSVFFEDLMEMYPHAKILLTVRDSPEEWWESARGTILVTWLSRRSFAEAWSTCGWIGVGTRLHILLLRRYGFMQRFFAMHESTHHKILGTDPGDAIRNYAKWIDHVKQVVPKERLVVFNVREGWAPLCNALGLPVPNTPYPRVNDAGPFKAAVRRYALKGFGAAALLLAISVGGGIAGMHAVRNWRLKVD